MPADGSAEGEKSVRSAAGAAAEMERLDIEKTSGERERSEPGGALSRTRRLKPVPAVLSLSPWAIGGEQPLNGKARHDGRACPTIGGEGGGGPNRPAAFALFGGDRMRLRLVRL